MEKSSSVHVIMSGNRGRFSQFVLQDIFMNEKTFCGTCSRSLILFPYTELHQMLINDFFVPTCKLSLHFGSMLVIISTFSSIIFHP